MIHFISGFVWCVCLLAAVVSTTFAGSTATLRLMAEGFVSPTALVSVDAKSGRCVVVDQVGVARVMEKDGTLRDEAFLDVTGRLAKLNSGFEERGLLGIALHPKFDENRKFYVYYSAPKRAGLPEDWDHTSRLSEFKVRDLQSLTTDLQSERVVMEIDKPWFNHNGGCLAFGPDGYLYVAIGDGGNANGQGRGHSPISNGQDLNTLLGKILRIDVDGAVPYGIPQDNPFVKGPGKPEIYAYGFRNPWKFSFDRGGEHGLFVGDIGQNLYEEVDLVVKGGNYGWFIREGRHCFNPADPKTAPSDCALKGADGRPLIDPIIEYKNPNGFRNDPEAWGISVMGGYVYRGDAIPKLQGRYVFGDWSRSWALPESVLLLGSRTTSKDSDPWTLTSMKIALEDGGVWKGYITGFGEDAAGELYVLVNGSNGLTGKTGKVFKLVAAVREP